MSVAYIWRLWSYVIGGVWFLSQLDMPLNAQFYIHVKQLYMLMSNTTSLQEKLFLLAPADLDRRT